MTDAVDCLQATVVAGSAVPVPVYPERVRSPGRCAVEAVGGPPECSDEVPRLVTPAVDAEPNRVVLYERVDLFSRPFLIGYEGAPGRPPLVGTAHCSGFRELGQQRGDLPVTPPGDVLVAQRRLRCRMTKAAHQFRECRTHRCGQDSAGMPKVVEA